MLETRTVRVRDVALRPFSRAQLPSNVEPGEHIVLKADSDRPDRAPDKQSGHIDWASVHMNMDIDSSQPPGKRLMLAIADLPGRNGFRGALDGVALVGRVYGPEPNDEEEEDAPPPSYRLVISTNSGTNEQDVGFGNAEGDIELRFDDKEAAGFFQSLLYWWFVHQHEE